MKTSAYILLTLISTLFITACSGIKQCRPPELNLPDRIVANATDTTTIADIKWWNLFADTSLCALIDRALVNNKNLLIAAAKVEEARELYGVSKSNQLPELKYSLFADNETNDYYGEKSVRDPQLDIKATISWEIDFWGRLKSANDRSKHTWLQSLAAERAVKLMLIAEVAETYFKLVALDTELSIVRHTLTTRSEGMALARLRFDVGLTSETVYQQAKVEYATTATMVPNLEKQIENTMSALAVLIGEYPGTYIQRGDIEHFQITPSKISIGVPSELLQRRPDLEICRQELKIALADVGIAYADRFPRFLITATGGVENNEIANIIKSPFSYLSGSISGPIFDFKKRSRKHKAAIAAYTQSKYAYEQAVLEAFKETYNAVKTYEAAYKTIRLKAALRDAALKYVELATLQYKAGSIAYIDVLDAQRRYFDAQIGLSNAVRDENIALVWLYKALGGGLDS